MAKLLNMSAVMLLAISLTVGCQALTGRTAGENIDDATITASVKTKLVADKFANLTRVDVDTNNRIVYLNGTVASAEQRLRAETLALDVQGVRTVVNNLQIQRP